MEDKEVSFYLLNTLIIQTRECKGLKFSLKSQKIVSRPYHKFWSIGETFGILFPCVSILQVPEATEDKIPLQSITSIVEQYDGYVIRICWNLTITYYRTMITPVKTEENAPLQLVTRNGDTLSTYFHSARLNEFRYGQWFCGKKQREWNRIWGSMYTANIYRLHSNIWVLLSKFTENSHVCGRVSSSDRNKAQHLRFTLLQTAFIF